MEIIFVVLLFITFGTASAGNKTGPLVEPCNSDDLPCLNNSTHLFLHKIQHGLPQYEIQPIDPLVIKSLEHGRIGASFKFSNVTILGLKDMTVADFKMDMNAKKVVLETTCLETMTGLLAILPLSKGPTPKSEPFTARAFSTVTNKYSYELKKNEKGVEHFEVGPEQFECKALGPQKQKLGQSQETDLPEDVLCALLKHAYKVVIQNMREAAKIIPAKGFIKNIH